MLKDMPWLTAQRARLYASGIALVLVLTQARSLLLFYRAGGYGAKDFLLGSDFLTFWAASLQILAGHAAEVYVPELHLLAERPYLRDGYEAFFYPPPMLILCLPLALAPYFVSFFVFIGVTASSFAVVIWRILRTPWALVAILAYAPVYLNAVAGQNAFLTVSILGCGLGIMNRRPRLAGVILGLMVIKPHLALAVPIALIVTGRWRTLIWAGISSTSLVVLSGLLFGLDTWLKFLDVSHSAGQALENGEVGFSLLQSVFAAARMLGAGAGTAYVIHGLAALGMVCVLIWMLRQKISAAAERSIIVLACLLVTPFSLFYDMLILALPLAWMLREWLKVGFPAWSKMVLGVTFLAPMVFYLPVLYQLSAVQPLPFGAPVIILFCWLLVRENTQTRRAAHGEPGGSAVRARSTLT
ncbi:glycosyltransferase family 87 protein [Bradyrhizobium uaiense]|uniref:DUF2029 domain-containing protein n=1 Tax=Bradyrhizobium uaiense TaxID=2594946 RepID=A0A6P1BI59_9BRAD|nr:glycosyltransferase family 87 protein [Bradyrhizobium uaiense]NEU97301.1 DUF2029 domain-containing protein [Bradyrhizobium uaiense]